MTFRDETKSPSWSVMVLLTLALAGCGGEPDTARTTDDAASGGQQTFTQQPQELPSPGTTSSAGKQYQQPSDPAGPDGSEDEIENPILADPLPVPVPEGEGPDLVEDPGFGNEGQAGSDDRPAEEDPLAERPVLHWDSPMTREDGSKLYPGEISGYRIYYRLRHQDEFQSLLVPGPDAESLALSDFEPGAYEFAVSALDTNGLESRRSEPVPVDLI